MLRPQPQHHLAAFVFAVTIHPRRRNRQRDAIGEPHRQAPACPICYPAIQKIHRRRADEAGDETCRRVVVQLVRRANLLDHAVAHHDDAVGERHRLDLVVRHVDRGGAHRWCSFLISVRICARSLASRLDSGSSNRNTLGLRTMARPIATRWRWPPESCTRLAIQQRLDVQDACRLVDAALDLGLGEFPQLQPERHVVEHAHVRIERVVLEHHRDVAIARRHVVHDVAADPDLAVGDLLETGDHAQRGRLAAARGPDEHDELLIGDLEIDPFHCLHAAIIDFDDFANRNLGHRLGVPSLVSGWRFSQAAFSPWWHRRSGRPRSSPSGRRRSEFGGKEASPLAAMILPHSNTSPRIRSLTMRHARFTFIPPVQPAKSGLTIRLAQQTLSSQAVHQPGAFCRPATTWRLDGGSHFPTERDPSATLQVSPAVCCECRRPRRPRRPTCVRSGFYRMKPSNSLCAQAITCGIAWPWPSRAII